MGTVWILGAGFSRSLGGPLFETLFSPWLMPHLEAHFPANEFPHLYGDLASLAHWLYNYGRRFALGRSTRWNVAPPGEELWQDAEQYLQILDDAALQRSPWTTRIADILKAYWNADLPNYLLEINGAARRLLAAECSAFMRALHPNSPPLIPYREWARQLRRKDTIINFNYDGLLEELGNQSGNIECIVPDERLRSSVPRSMARAYKLHGSVNWLLEDVLTRAPERIERSTDFAAVNCERHVRLVIGSPGLTKSKTTEKLYDPLWVPAGVAIAEASAIVFVGYSFPPTDTYAQRFLLDAIEHNQRNYLAVHVVLGPDSPDILRVRQLLALALASRAELPLDEHFTLEQLSPNARCCNLRVWHLYAADFLGLAKGDQIARPFRVHESPL